MRKSKPKEVKPLFGGQQLRNCNQENKPGTIQDLFELEPVVLSDC